MIRGGRHHLQFTHHLDVIIPPYLHLLSILVFVLMKTSGIITRQTQFSKSPTFFELGSFSKRSHTVHISSSL